MVSRGHKNERGVAILAVLLGIALMTLIVVDFALTSGLGFVSAANQANELRAGYLGRSAISIGLALLAQDARAKLQQPATQAAATPCESFSDVWAAPFPPMPLEGGTVSLSIVDEARKLPINAMVNQSGAQAGTPNQAAIAKVQRLFTILDVDPDLIQGIVDWITPSGANSTGGTGDFYMGLVPPYQPRYGPMPTIGDLQMVAGFNEAIFNRVSPFLTVMPLTGTYNKNAASAQGNTLATAAQVNANTASPQVLAALEPELMEDQKIVQEIVEARAIKPFSTPADIMNLPDVGPVGQRLSRDVEMRSQFFTIIGTGTYAGARKIITATFHRENNGIGDLAAWHED
jgi:general secretion pathway protein K